MKPIKEDSKEIDGTRIIISIFKVHKGYLLLLSDNEEMGIGSVTLGTPPTIEGLKSVVASHELFGMHKKFLSKIVAQKATQLLKQPVLVLLFITSKEKEEELAKPIVGFLDEVLHDINAK